MTDAFQFTKTEFSAFSKLLVRAPRALTKAYGMTLNDLAYNARQQSFKYIDQTMTVRSKQFVSSKLRFERAKFSDGINNMQSVMGSVGGPRFTGWREQMDGSDMPRDRAITTQARRGSTTNRVAPRARLRPGKSWKSPRSYKGRSRTAKATAMLQHLSRIKYRQPFLVYGHSRVQPGIWIFKAGKLTPLQLFKRSVTVKKDPWINNAVRDSLRAHPFRRILIKRAKKELRNIATGKLKRM